MRLIIEISVVGTRVEGRNPGNTSALGLGLAGFQHALYGGDGIDTRRRDAEHFLLPLYLVAESRAATLKS
jgi:hypothetical protein